MGKGSKAPAETKSTVYNSSLPEYARPYFEDLMTRAQQETQQPYQAYSGPRVAGFNADETSAFGLGRSYANSGTPEALTGGLEALKGAAERANSMANFSYTPGAISGDYSTGNFATREFDPNEAINKFMNPYVRLVIQSQMDEARRQGGIQRQGIDDSFAKAKAFGGYRQGIEMSQQRKNESYLLDKIYGEGMGAAYDKAMATGLQAFQGDEARKLQVQQATEQSRQFGAGYGQTADIQNETLGLQAALDSAKLRLASADSAISAANASAQIAQIEDAIRRSKIDTLSGIGYQQRELKQKEYDVAYQDFVNQRDYERQNLQFLSGILNGVPTQANSDVIQYQAPPSSGSQALGAGLTGLSMMRMMGGM